MHSLLLLDADEREIPVDELRRILQSATGFQRLRQNTPAGIPIEADFVEGTDFTTVGLSTTRKAISIRGTSGAALSAAWILRNHLDIPLRMVDTDYSFDLMLQDYATIDELEAAIDEARAK